VRLFSQNVKVEALKRAPLFEGLSKKELTELARATDDLSVAPGTVLCARAASVASSSSSSTGRPRSGRAGR
jgi:hypothetical protein